jgi:hypothetical protein
MPSHAKTDAQGAYPLGDGAHTVRVVCVFKNDELSHGKLRKVLID